MTGIETIDLSALGPDRAYRFLMSAVIPRPIAFVTTISRTGVVNAAPFSSLVVLAIDPPTVGIVIGGAERRKDTLANIEETNEFVVNSVPEDLADQVQKCAEPFAPDICELDVTDLETVASDCVRPPRVVRSPIQFECHLDKIVPFGAVPDNLVAGMVLRAHVRKGVMTDGKIDPAAWTPLGRIGGRRYCRVREFIDV